MGHSYSAQSEHVINDVYDVNVRLGYGRLSDISNECKILVMPQTKCKNIYNKSYFIPPFSGIWSVDTAYGDSPNQRMNHFTVTSQDPDLNYAYVGCGIDNKGNYLNDIWKFNLKNYCWEKFLTHGEYISERRGASATLYKDYIVVFGGFNGKDYLNDIHTINVKNGYIQLIDTVGDKPEPRCNALIAIYNMKLYVWGGSNEMKPDDLSILDLQTKIWTTKELDINGRTMIPSLHIGKYLYAYGGSNLESMVRIDLDEEKGELLPSRGSPPLADVVGASMVLADGYIFYFGGQNKNHWTLMYAYNIQRNWWFVFFITPDGETVSYKDGKFSKANIFLIPRLHSFSMTYSPKKREIIGFLGCPFHDSKSLFKVSISDALTFLHLRDDMLAMMLLI